MSNGTTSAKIHRIGPEHAENVAQLATQTTKHLFGTKTIHEILTDSFLSLGLFDTDATLQACVCFAHFPNLATVPPSDWIYWVKSLYGLDFLTVSNTNWINFVVYHQDLIGEFLKLILQAFFNWYDMVEWVLMVVPPNTKNLDFIECFGERIVPKDLDYNTDKVFNLFLISKKTIMFDYRIRRAIDEDNDDLVELLPRKLQEYYGDYYVTELLTVERNNRREIIVAELNHKIVGALITNSTVNCDLLNEIFELTVFNGLKKPHSSDMIEMEHQMVATVDPFRIDEEQEGSLDSAERSDDTSALSETSPSMQHTTIESSDDFSLVDLSSITSVRYYEADYQNRRTVKSYSVLMTNESTLHPDWIMAQQPSLEKQITQGIQMEKFKPSPTFYGETNAFAIETITILPEYESSFCYLLHTIFQCYPDLDYAILSMKHRHYVANYILKNFVRVTPRPLSNFKHELYVVNKYSLMNEISVCPWEIQEKNEILEILNDFNVKKMEIQISNILSDLNEEFMLFLITCNDTMIGLIVTVESDDLFFLKTHYDLSIWLNSDRNQSIYGYIKLFLLSPIYHNHSQYILRELHRLTNYDYLFCRINYDTFRNTTESTTFIPFTAMIINNIIGYMVPLLPKLPQDYETNIINDYKISPVVSQKRGKLSDLFLSMPRITSLPRIEINHRIIVVGCGDVAIAFLKSLIYHQQQEQPKALIVYNNITLVCAHGFGRDDATNPIRQMMFIDNNNDKNAYNLETFVNVVYGIMTGIDRKDQYLIVNNNNYVSYDHLVLLCGEQFQKPIGKQKIELPENIFIINTDVDATVALATVKHLKFTLKPGQKHATEPKPILVYGHYLEALCCVAALLEMGVPGKSIIYVDPGDNIITIAKRSKQREHYEYLTTFFNNDDCEIAAFNRMIIEGVTVYQNFKFYDWNLNNEYNIVTSAKFQTEYKQLDLEFIVMFFYYQKSVSLKTFQAINNCGLVFDGHLVINKNNETSDPNIFAAGSLTKYSKRYHCDHLSHRYFNSYEIGHNLGEQIKHKLVPAEYLPEVKKTKTTLKQPLVRHCKLPGDLNYLSVMKPGKPLVLNCGKVIVTGSCATLDIQGYFRLHLNRYNVVESITCLSKEAFSAKNLIALYGKHEKFLNNLLWHYENGAISDLFQYFKQPWCYAIYNEDFAQLIEDFDELFAQLSDEMQLNDFEEIEQFCEEHGYFEQIGKKLLEFLDERSDFLPMYATPNFVRMLKHDVKDNISAVDDD